MENFYIIQRSGAITEVPYSEQNYKTTYEQWVNGGRLVVRPKGHENPIGINAVDITNIFDEEAYDSFVKQVKPKLYIKNGVWFDGHERNEVFVEKYIERRRKEQLTLSTQQKKDETPSPEMQQKIEEIRDKIRSSLCPND